MEGAVGAHTQEEQEEQKQRGRLVGEQMSTGEQGERMRSGGEAAYSDILAARADTLEDIGPLKRLPLRFLQRQRSMGGTVCLQHT